MRLVSYNILDGGEGRADPLAETIEAQRPDVVVLVEADDPQVVDRIARRLKMDVVTGQGRKHALAILSRWPIVESVNHAMLREELTGCLLEAKIAQPDFAEWTVTGVHLHPRAAEADETIREGEIEVILDVHRSLRQSGRAHVLAGDFNSNSPIQRIVPDQCKPRTRQEITANGGALPRRAISKLVASGYVDTLQAVEGESAATMGSFTTQYPGQRVDYIFAFGIDPARIKKARIEQDRLAQFASDHFPIFAQIE